MKDPKIPKRERGNIKEGGKTWIDFHVEPAKKAMIYLANISVVF